jgi:hypothetical protein
MGETILITVGAPTVGEVPIYPGVVYLCPTSTGSWNLIDFDLPIPAETYVDLESAMHGAHEYVGRKEAARR